MKKRNKILIGLLLAIVGLFIAIYIPVVGVLLHFAGIIILIMGIAEKIKAKKNAANKTPQKQNNTKEKPAAKRENSRAFDVEAFKRDYASYLTPRLPANIEDADTHGSMLKTLKNALPTVELILNLDEHLLIKMASGGAAAKLAVGEIAMKANKLIEALNFPNLEKSWQSLSTEQLLDSFILLDYYCHILKPEASMNLRYARERIGAVIKSRLLMTAQKAQPASVPEPTPIPTNKGTAYTGKLSSGIDYIVDYVAKEDLYIIEIHDTTGKYLADSLWSIGKMGYASFVLTEEEYLLKNSPAVDGNIPELNALVKRLLENLPKDRLITLGYINALKNNAREELIIDLKNETMDDCAYQKYRNKKAVSYINSLETVYVMFCKSVYDHIPSVDGFGYAWIFSKQEYAENIKRKNAGEVDLEYKAFSLSEFKSFVLSWYKYGIVRFKLNIGTNDRYAEVDRDDFLPLENHRQWDYIGSSLNQLIIRFKQNQAIRNNPGASATAMTMWDAICHELYRSVFLVPISYEGEPDDAEDWVIHATMPAAKRLTQKETERQLGEQAADGSGLIAEDKDGNPIYMLNKEYLYGSEKYRFPEVNEVTAGKIMHLRTAMNNGAAFLCAFTDLTALHAILGENVRVGVFTYEEIIEHMDDFVSTGGAIQGLVINPGTINLTLNRQDIANAEKVKNEPHKIFAPPSEK